MSGGDRTPQPHSQDRTGRFGEAFAVREFRLLWLSLAQSGLGDQLAKVALSVLVLERTGSPFLTAATYGVTYLPYLIAGPLLTPLADRYPRRSVLATADLLRGALIALMVVPGMPLWSLFVLVFCTGVIRPPFEAARSAVLPDMLPGDMFVVGSAITQTTNQITQVLGFAVGGITVGLIGPTWALAVNALSFFLGGLLFRFGLAARPAPTGHDRPGMRQVIGQGTKTVFTDRKMRALIGFGMLAGFYIAPEVLAVPYVRQTLDLGPGHAGILLAVGPFGLSLGSVLLTRLVRPSRRINLFGPLAVVGLLLLLPFWWTPNFAVSCALVFLSGMAGGYNLAVNQAFIAIVPNTSRGQALGLAQTMLMITQGLSTIAFGAVTKIVTTPATIAFAGAVGAAVAALLWLSWTRTLGRVR